MKKLLICSGILLAIPCYAMEQKSLTQEDLNKLPAAERLRVLQVLMQQAEADARNSGTDQSELTDTGGASTTTSDPDSLPSYDSTGMASSQRSIADSRSAKGPAAKAVDRSPQESRKLAASAASISPRPSVQNASSMVESRSLEKLHDGTGAAAKPRLLRSLSLGRKMGMDTQHALEDSGERRSPRSPRPSVKKDELAKMQADCKADLMSRSSKPLTETDFQELLTKAFESDLLNYFVSWVNEKAAIISLASFRGFIDVLIDEAGVDFSALGLTTATEKRSTIKSIFQKLSLKPAKENVKFIQQLLKTIETYSVKLQAFACKVFPVGKNIGAEDYSELAGIIVSAVGSYPPKVETVLCSTLRNALNAVSEESEQSFVDARKELCETLVGILQNAYAGKIKIANLDKVTLGSLVQKHKGLPDQLILASFVIAYGGKVEGEVYDKLLLLARELDGKSKAKKDESCIQILHTWALGDHDHCLTSFCFNQIVGEKGDAGAQHSSLESLGISRVKRFVVQQQQETGESVTSAVAPAAPKSKAGLKESIQRGKDAKDEESTWTNNANVFEAAKGDMLQDYALPKSAKMSAAQAKAAALLQKYQKKDEKKEALKSDLERNSFDDNDIKIDADFEHGCAICGEEYDVRNTSLSEHACTVCWLCKEQLRGRNVIRVNVRRECSHKIHKNCCHRIDPEDILHCGVCKALVQPSGEFKRAYAEYQASDRIESTLDESAHESVRSHTQESRRTKPAASWTNEDQFDGGDNFSFEMTEPQPLDEAPAAPRAPARPAAVVTSVDEDVQLDESPTTQRTAAVKAALTSSQRIASRTPPGSPVSPVPRKVLPEQPVKKATGESQARGSDETPVKYAGRGRGKVMSKPSASETSPGAGRGRQRIQDSGDDDSSKY